MLVLLCVPPGRTLRERRARNTWGSHLVAEAHSTAFGTGRRDDRRGDHGMSNDRQPPRTPPERLADEIEAVADAIYNQNAPRSRQLSAIAARVARVEIALSAVSETRARTIWPMEREHLIAWHDGLSLWAGQSDDLQGERMHKQRADELRRGK